MKVEIKVLWCKGITAFNFFQKLTPYIVVSIQTIDERIVLSESQKQEQKTHVDDGGDANPEWNYTMHFDLDDTILSNLRNFLLLFEIKNHSQVLMDRNIGDVKVPLHDLVHSVGVGVVRFASYEVRNFDGKSNGILDFSYKVMGEHCVRYDYDHDHVGQSGSLNLDRIDYPRVEIDGYGGNGVPSAPPLFGVEENGRYQAYPSSVYPPPGSPMWTPPPPPPRVQPVAYRPPPEEYYNQHSGSESCCGYHGYSHRPPPEQYYDRQHSRSESCCGYHGYGLRPPPQEYYNQQHSGGVSCCGYRGYSHRSPPPAPLAPAAGEQYYHRHSNSDGSGGYGYHHW